MRHLMSPLDLSVEELAKVFPMRVVLPHPKVKVFLIRSGLFPVTQISVLCVIQKKVRR